jgi:hypothetical protein
MRLLLVVLMSCSTLLLASLASAQERREVYQATSLFCSYEADMYRILDEHQKNGMNAAVALSETIESCFWGTVEFLPIDHVKVYKGLKDVKGQQADLHVFRVLPCLEHHRRRRQVEKVYQSL